MSPVKTSLKKKVHDGADVFVSKAADMFNLPKPSAAMRDAIAKAQTPCILVLNEMSLDSLPRVPPPHPIAVTMSEQVVVFAVEPHQGNLEMRLVSCSLEERHASLVHTPSLIDLSHLFVCYSL